MDLTTGILVRNLSTDTIIITVLNLNSEENRQVTIHAFDWGGTVPSHAIPIPVSPDNTITVGPLNYAESIVSIPCTTHRYEVRVSYVGDSQIVATVFGQHSPITARERNEVVQHELKPVRI